MVNAIVQYKGNKKSDSWARWMVNRTRRQNKNNLIGLIGSTGSGKTYSAISICEIMAKIDGVPFTIDHIVFSLMELMDLINSGKLKKGSKIVFDEPQISISARDFQSEANKVFNYLLSTFRHRNLTLIFCTPFETLLDKNTRKLFHGRFETMSINRNTKTCRLKPRFVEYSDFKSEPYRKQMIVMYKNKEGINKHEKLFYWDVPLPSKELIDDYEEKKLAFTDNINKNISVRLKKYEESGKGVIGEEQKIDTRKELTEHQKKVLVSLAKHGNNKDVVKELGLNYSSSVSLAVAGARKKGYRVEEFRENA
jgi:ABC-type oligopeptide transport system ATPase subunit